MPSPVNRHVVTSSKHPENRFYLEKVTLVGYRRSCSIFKVATDDREHEDKDRLKIDDEFEFEDEERGARGERRTERSPYQHTVPVAEKPITFPNRLCVRFEYKLATGKRGG